MGFILKVELIAFERIKVREKSKKHRIFTCEAEGNQRGQRRSWLQPLEDRTLPSTEMGRTEEKRRFRGKVKNVCLSV